MTGSGACHEECLCYFPSREEINFLWFFRNAACGRRNGRFQAQGERNRLMMWWGLFSSDASIAERNALRSWMRARAQKSCGRPVPNSGPCLWSPRTYCVVIWCYCWNVMKNYHQLALNASIDGTTFPRWNRCLMGTAKRSVNVCWR